MSNSTNISQLKTIITKINTLFNTDYNVSSFSALSGDTLLKFLIKVLKHLEIEQPDQTDSFLMILNVLKSIKYSPEGNIQPNDFREGLVSAKKEIIYPIFCFLLEDEDNIKRRYYLSKYVDKIDVPTDIASSEARIKHLDNVYLQLIDQFWSAYSENIKEEASAKESKELEEDIHQMRTELKNLERRIELQSRKIYSESFLEKTSLLVKERKRHEKIKQQLEGDRNTLQQQTETLRFYKRRDVVTSLEDLLEKSEIYANSYQVYSISLKDISQDLILTQRVCSDESLDISQLEEEQAVLQQVVNNLNVNKEQDDSICAMQNQQRILTRKKTLLSKQVIKLRLDNDLIMNKIEELIRILGGDVLKGKVFKNYVSDLKSMCKVYKENKLFLKNLEIEEHVLRHTLEEIFLLEPDLKKKMEDNGSSRIPEEIRHVPLEELRLKTVSLEKEHKTLLRQSYEEENKYLRVKKSFCESTSQLDQVKSDFNEETDNLITKIDDLEAGIKEVGNLLKIEEDDLVKEEQEFEKLQDNLLRYSQMFIDNAGDVSTQDLLRHKLQVTEDAVKELKQKVDEKNKMIEGENEEKRKTQNVIVLIREGKLT